MTGLAKERRNKGIKKEYGMEDRERVFCSSGTRVFVVIGEDLAGKRPYSCNSPETAKESQKIQNGQDGQANTESKGKWSGGWRFGTKKQMKRRGDATRPTCYSVQRKRKKNCQRTPQKVRAVAAERGWANGRL